MQIKVSTFKKLFEVGLAFAEEVEEFINHQQNPTVSVSTSPPVSATAPVYLDTPQDNAVNSSVVLPV